MTKRVRMAMIGGGDGAFIGAVHRTAARIADHIDLVAGVFGRDPVKAHDFGVSLGVAPGRSYRSLDDFLAGEAAVEPERRTEIVVIVTPNDSHFPIAKAALSAGFHVLCDKPATISLQQAIELRADIAKHDRLYGLTHTYLGYPMVEQSRRFVADGKLGKIHRVMVEYPQGWLAGPQEVLGSKQAAWRTDPARSGPSGCFGDIGSHAHNLAEYISGKRVTAVTARLRTVIPGRRLDDDGDAWFEMDDGVWGGLFASQVCAGISNGLAIRVFGDDASLTWRQEEPNIIVVETAGGPVETYRAGAGMPGLCDDVLAQFRTPGGHSEGYLEAFANIYARFAAAVRAWQPGTPAFAPGIDEGIRGMAFIEASLASSAAGSRPIALAVDA